MEKLTPSVLAALVGFLPLAGLIFLCMSVRKAVLTTFLLGWLFLPQATIEVRGVLPDYDRYLAVNLGVLLGIALLAPNRLTRLKPTWVDLPMLLWCTCPFLTSLANGLGPYDGGGAVLERVLLWGLPYAVGRAVLGDAPGVRQVAFTIFLGGLIYMPLALWEVRMSPQLHKMVYGFQQHEFSQTYRLGGWRPQVFLKHGLALGMWMTAASLCGIWLWRTRAVRLGGELMPLLVVPLVMATAACKSLGALVLLTAGASALWLARRLGRAWPIVLLTLIPPTYVWARTTGAWTGENLVQAIRDNVNQDRAQSVEFRLQNEDMLAEKALHRPALGWGGWGRYRIKNERGKDVTTVDGFWIQVLGENGFYGLTLFGLIFLVPVWLVARGGHAFWRDGLWTPAGVLAALLALYLIDGLLNAMFNPFCPLAMGALSGLWARPGRVPARPRPRRRPVLTQPLPAGVELGAARPPAG